MNLEFDDPLGFPKPHDPTKIRQFKITFLIQEEKTFVKDSMAHYHDKMNENRYLGSTCYMQGNSTKKVAQDVISFLNRSKYIDDLGSE